VKHLKTLKQDEKIIYELGELYDSFGYGKIQFNTLEDYENYQFEKNIIEKESILKVMLNGKLFALRPDMTVPITKRFAQEKVNEILSKKVYYYDNVFRITDDINYHSQEKKQLGLENIGESGFEADAELIHLAGKSLDILSDEYLIDVSNIKYIKGILKAASLTTLNENQILEMIHQKNLCDLSKKLEELNLEPKISEAIMELPNLYGDFKSILDKAKKYVFNEKSREALLELEELCKILQDYGSLKNVNLDLSMITDLKYYSGTIFQGYINGISSEVLKGGRYDDLAKNFGKDLPAIGFAIDMDEILRRIVYIEEHKIDYLVFYEKKDRKKAFDISEGFRKLNKIVRMETNRVISSEELVKLKEKYDKILEFKNNELVEKVVL